MRLLALLLAAAAALTARAAEPGAREYVQAVEFPYFLYPRQYWERELVWLKTIGIRTVAFPIPRNWHQPEPGAPDFTGRTSPRRDLLGFLRLLRRLEMRAWIRPEASVKGWLRGGYPRGASQDRDAAREWWKQLERELQPHFARHGGPISFAEVGGGVAGLPRPPAPVVTVSAKEPSALARSRVALATGRGSLLWQEVEDALYPVGWEAPGAPIVSPGAVSLGGEERATIAALRRDAALLRHWAPLLAGMRVLAKPAVRPVIGRFPSGVTAVQLTAAPQIGSAVSIVNQGSQPFRGALRVLDPVSRRSLQIPGVQVAPREALWLPVGVSLAGGGLCRDCFALSKTERIVYATAELLAIEYENGILAMEFAAPVAGEAILQLSRQPSGPFLAAGRPTEFDFDAKTFRARLPIPAGQGTGSRSRIGLAIEPPESSAFFVDARRLIIGEQNRVSTSYSSPELAARSRLRLPEKFTARRVEKSPTEIEYEVAVPADALHGDWADLAIEADGVSLGRARVQIFRPASVRVNDAVALHFGSELQLPVEPPVVPVDARAGRNLEIVIRNNTPSIQTYTLEAEGSGFAFFPNRSEISIGAIMERTVQLRVFPEDAQAGLHDWRLRIGGAARMEVPARLLVLRRGQAAAFSADLDGDGGPEWVLENHKARAVFSAQDGGRWLEFAWKDTGTNVLPLNGALAGRGPVSVRAQGGALEFTAGDWKRTVTLAGEDAALTIEQTGSLPADAPRSGKHGEIRLDVVRESPARAVYRLETAPPVSVR